MVGVGGTLPTDCFTTTDCTVLLLLGQIELTFIWKYSVTLQFGLCEIFTEFVGAL